MQLTEHFKREEFELAGPMPDECVPMYTVLAHNLLELVRIHFKIPVEITSGYRPPSDNEEAHGVKNSQHMATADYCAADFKFKDAALDMRSAFDWIRLHKDLVWDQVILEHGVHSNVIHLSVTRTTNRRMALEGDTANRSAYSPWSVVPYSQNV